MISHANILSNMAVIAEASDADASTVFVSWLPVFHDMGFFGKVLLPIYLGVLSVLMAPAAFVQKPSAGCRPSRSIAARIAPRRISRMTCARAKSPTTRARSSI